mmetsp:Transcript_34403/g.55250  ORF Transcript_34403/g.55250 Transcript_34403/m.55250 type:complete len:228 (+) Transcript_34403:3-686(+)
MKSLPQSVSRAAARRGMESRQWTRRSREHKRWGRSPVKPLGRHLRRRHRPLLLTPQLPLAMRMPLPSPPLPPRSPNPPPPRTLLQLLPLHFQTAQRHFISPLLHLLLALPSTFLLPVPALTPSNMQGALPLPPPSWTTPQFLQLLLPLQFKKARRSLPPPKAQAPRALSSRLKRRSYRTMRRQIAERCSAQSRWRWLRVTLRRSCTRHWMTRFPRPQSGSVHRALWD